MISPAFVAASPLHLLALVEEGAPSSSWTDLWTRIGPGWQIAIVIGGAALIYIVFRAVVLRSLERWTASTTNDLDDRLVHFAKQFFGIVLTFLVLVAALEIFGIEITPLLAIGGIATIALGMAAKETIADVLAGIFLIADRPMRIGDRVKLEFIGRDWGGWGDVVDIGLRRTLIRNTDGVVVNYPNSVLANSVITNFSHEEGPVRVRVRFQVAYDADIELTRDVAVKAIEKAAGVNSGTVQVLVRSLWDQSRGHLLSGVLLEARYKIDAISDRTRIRSDVLERLLSTLREHKVPIARFQHDSVHEPGDE